MAAVTDAALPLILFGAADRHNLGDLLFPHLVAARFPGREIHVAGLVERDLRACGGHRVRAFPALLAELGGAAELVHCGGEILTTGLWEAAVMLESFDTARAAVAAVGDDPAAQREWAAGRLGCRRAAPYVIGRDALPAGSRLHFHAVGGVGLAAFGGRDEVLAALRSADSVSVRDGVTHAALQAGGIDAALLADPVAGIGAWSATIAARLVAGAVAEVGATFPDGYLAVQLSGEFGDDATLATLAGQLDRVAAARRLGVVLFRAGAAPWHDDPEVLARLAARIVAPARVFADLDVWNIVALIAGARLAIGSSLHVRIVADALDVPALSLDSPTGGAKLRAWRSTWAPQAADVVAPAAAGHAGPA